MAYCSKFQFQRFARGLVFQGLVETRGSMNAPNTLTPRRQQNSLNEIGKDVESKNPPTNSEFLRKQIRTRHIALTSCRNFQPVNLFGVLWKRFIILMLNCDFECWFERCLKLFLSRISSHGWHTFNLTRISWITKVI